MAPLSYLLPVAIFVVLTFMVLEALRWQRGALIISRRRFRIRMLAGVLLVLLLAALFVGRFILVLTDPSGPRAELFWAWWLGCLLVALGLLYLAGVDMNELDSTRLERENELWRDFARLVLGKERPPEGDSPKQDE